MNIMLENILTNIAQGSKKPVAYAVAFKQDRKWVYLKTMPVFWTKKAARDTARELTKVTGTKFVVAEAWIRGKK